MTDLLIDRKSAEDLIDFWNNYVIDMKLVNDNTARSLGAASKAILSVEEGWENLDITEIDLERYFHKFAAKNARKYKPRTLEVYKRRFKRAVSDYIDYLNNPTTWTGPSANRTNSDKTSHKKQKKQTSSQQMSFLAGTQAPQPDSDIPMVTYNFRLRKNCIVQLRLPVDLTKGDVERLNLFLDLQALSTSSNE